MILLIFPSLITSEELNDDQFNQVVSQPLRKLSNYKFNPESSLLSRVKAAPDFIIQTWKEWDKRTNYTVYTPTKKEMMIIEKSLNKLPAYYREIFKKRVVGIYFINNLLGSGISDFIFDEKYNTYSYLIFNPKVLQTNISAWITIKENTCFRNDDKNIKIKVDCGDEYSGFMYILLHEGTHSVDYAEQLTPYVEDFMQKIPGFQYKNSSFINEVWSSYNTFNAHIKFPYQKQITFYGMNNGPKIPISQASNVYSSLILNTPFISLYGALSWAEDIAEFNTFYYLTTELKQPYRISILKNNKEIIFEPFQSKSIKKRVSQFKALLKK